MKPPIYLFAQEVKLKSFTGITPFGEKAYTQINTLDTNIVKSYNPNNGEYIIKVRFEPKVVTSRQSLDESKQYRGTMFTLGTDIPTQSTVEFEGEKYIVGECIKHYSTIGISHLEVLLT
jgi:hypothetical protein